MNERVFGERALSLAAKWHRLSYAILRNEEDACDAVQEALLRAWRGIKSLKEDDYFETWFTRILINESRRILRRGAKSTALQGGGDFAPTARVLPSHPVADDSDAERLNQALAALDVKLRLPVLLYHMEGYKIPEIANMLKTPVPTVKWRLKKGREALKQLLVSNMDKEAEV